MEYEYSNGTVPGKQHTGDHPPSFMDGLSKMLTLGLADILDMAAPDSPTGHSADDSQEDDTAGHRPTSTKIPPKATTHSSTAPNAKARKGKLVQSSGSGLQKRLTDDTAVVELQDRPKQAHRPAASSSQAAPTRHVQLEAGYENVEYHMDSPGRAQSRGILDAFVTGVSSFKQKATNLLDTLDASFEMMFHGQAGAEGGEDGPITITAPTSPITSAAPHNTLSPRSSKPTSLSSRPSGGSSSTRSKLNARPLVQHSSGEVLLSQGGVPAPGSGSGRVSRSPRHSGEAPASTHRIPVIVPCKSSKTNTPRTPGGGSSSGVGGGGWGAAMSAPGQGSAVTVTPDEDHHPEAAAPSLATDATTTIRPGTQPAATAPPGTQDSSDPASAAAHAGTPDHVAPAVSQSSLHVKHMLDPSCPGCVHSKKLLIRASKKCQGLVEENHRLRGAALLDPALSDSVCQQLECLLADKAQLLLDKCRLQREVAGLQQLLAYTWEHYLSHVDNQHERDAESAAGMTGLLQPQYHHYPFDQQRYQDEAVAAALMSMASHVSHETAGTDQHVDQLPQGGGGGGGQVLDTSAPPELVHRLATLLGESSRLHPGRALDDEVEAVERYYSSLLETLSPAEPPPHHLEDEAAGMSCGHEEEAGEEGGRQGAEAVGDDMHSPAACAQLGASDDQERQEEPEQGQAGVDVQQQPELGCPDSPSSTAQGARQHDGSRRVGLDGDDAQQGGEACVGAEQQGEVLLVPCQADGAVGAQPQECAVGAQPQECALPPGGTASVISGDQGQSELVTDADSAAGEGGPAVMADDGAVTQLGSDNGMSTANTAGEAPAGSGAGSRCSSDDYVVVAPGALPQLPTGDEAVECCASDASKSVVHVASVCSSWGDSGSESGAGQLP